MMRFRAVISTVALAVACALSSGAAGADEGAQGFVEHQHQRLTSLLHQPASSAREGQIDKELDAMVDYTELARRSLGQPCPHTLPSCTNWAEKIDEADRAELTKLLKQLVEKNYKKN